MTIEYQSDAPAVPSAGSPQSSTNASTEAPSMATSEYLIWQQELARKYGIPSPMIDEADDTDH